MFLENKTLFSIIVPCFNSRKFLDRCIASVLNQTFDGWELIIVDDGSSDNSVLIARKYQETSNGKIKLIVSKDNEGQLLSRFKGVLASNGKYILFLDSDDSLVNTALEIIKNEINKNDMDLISFNPMLISTSNCKQIQLFTQRNTIFGNRNIISEYLCKRMYGYSCFFAIKKTISLQSFYDIEKFYELRYTEDLLYMYKVYLNSMSCTQIPNQIYNYYINENSASSNIDVKKYKDRFITLNYIYGENILSNSVEDSIKLLIIRCVLSYAREVCFLNKSIAKDELKKIRSSLLFEKYNKKIVLSDCISKILLMTLRFKMFGLMITIVRKYYNKKV